MTYVQHGDVLLKKTETIPAGAKHLKGESVIHPGNTGNNHTLVGGLFGIYQDGETKFVDVAEDTTITHNEHKTIALPTGKYALSFVQEFDHFADMQRAVVD